MRRISLLVVGVAALTALTGCPPTYPNCSSDESCTEKGEVCVQGQCKECATSAQCKEGFSCDANKCVPKSACQGDGDCSLPGTKCSKGRCIVPQCNATSPCADGKKCIDYLCVADNKLGPGKCNTTEDCGGNEECNAGSCVAKAAEPTASCDIAPIRFGFNEAQLSSDARDALAGLADCIKKDKAGGKVRLEGHADERGTEEFNLQLSNRRAASVKKYLGDLGVAGGRLETVGYGENRPAQSASTEEAWSANRRVEVVK